MSVSQFMQWKQFPIYNLSTCARVKTSTGDMEPKPYNHSILTILYVSASTSSAGRKVISTISKNSFRRHYLGKLTLRKAIMCESHCEPYRDNMFILLKENAMCFVSLMERDCEW